MAATTKVSQQASGAASMLPKWAKNSSRALALWVLLPYERQHLKPVIPHRHKVDERLQSGFKQAGESLQAKDQPFVRALVNTTLRHWFILDGLIASTILNTSLSNMTVLTEQAIKKALKSLEPNTRCLLRLGLSQSLFMDQIPDYAMISATLELAKSQRISAKQQKFIHSALSRILNASNPEHLTQNQDNTRNAKVFDIEGVATAYAWPTWLTQKLDKQQTRTLKIEPVAVGNKTIDATITMRQAFLKPDPGLWVRVNTLKTSIADATEVLSEQGIVFEIAPSTENLPEMLWLPDWKNNPASLPHFKEGWFYIQNLSSAALVNWIDSQPGQNILDVCAAPGSKTSHLAARLKNDGKILALDIAHSRLQRLEENIQRLGITCVKTRCADVLSWQTDERFDRILLDAPCSASGTISHHPDVLVQLRASTSASFQHTQLQLLNQAKNWLHVDGKLIYSTCSLDSDENENVISHFLEQNTDWQAKSHHYRMLNTRQDGFFGCVLSKH